MVLATSARAGKVDGFLEWIVTTTDRETESVSLVETEEEIDSFRQRYNLVWADQPYSTLRFAVGGLFEQSDANRISGLSSLDSKFTQLRPYVDLRLATDTLLGEINFTRSDEKVESSNVPTLQTIRDIFASTFVWDSSPRLPLVRLQYVHTDAQDKPRSTLDGSDDLTQLYSVYRPRDSLVFSYRGSHQETTDHIDDNQVKTVSHTGRVGYADQYWHGRIHFNVNTNLSWMTTETATSGQGEIDSPVFAVEGLASLDETPDTDPLLPNPALIDGNRNTSAGINLGLPPPAGDDRPRNIGLDLGEPREMNTLRVWVDRDLDPEIADYYTWRVYSSEDNDRWTLVEIVAQAPFGPFLNRFDVRFQNRSARYFKVVVDPLSPSVPLALNWPEIFVTEIEGILAQPAADVEASLQTSARSTNMALSTRLLERRDLFYEMTYFLRENSGAPATWTLSNGISFTQPLGSGYSVRARVAREDGKQQGLDRTQSIFSAALVANPVEALRMSVVVNGRYQEIGELTDDRTSVFFLTLVELYRGIDLNFSVGETFITDSLGRNLKTFQTNALATFVPHRWWQVNLTYQGRTSGPRYDVPGENVDQFIRAGEVAVTFNPLSTLYLYSSYRLENSPLIDNRRIINHTLSWNPLPYAALRVFLRYNENYRSDVDQRDSTIVPGIRWDITNRWYFQLSSQLQRLRSPVLQSDNRLLSATMRFSF